MMDSESVHSGHGRGKGWVILLSGWPCASGSGFGCKHKELTLEDYFTSTFVILLQEE